MHVQNDRKQGMQEEIDKRRPADYRQPESYAYTDRQKAVRVKTGKNIGRHVQLRDLQQSLLSIHLHLLCQA